MDLIVVPDINQLTHASLASSASLFVVKIYIGLRGLNSKGRLCGRASPSFFFIGVTIILCLQRLDSTVSKCWVIIVFQWSDGESETITSVYGQMCVAELLEIGFLARDFILENIDRALGKRRIRLAFTISKGQGLDGVVNGFAVLFLPKLWTNLGPSHVDHVVLNKWFDVIRCTLQFCG